MIGSLPLSGLWQSFKDPGQHDPADGCLHTYFPILLQFLEKEIRQKCYRTVPFL